MKNRKQKDTPKFTTADFVAALEMFDRQPVPASKLDELGLSPEAIEQFSLLMQLERLDPKRTDDVKTMLEMLAAAHQRSRGPGLN